MPAIGPVAGAAHRDAIIAHIVLFDGFDLLDALGPYEVFQAAGLLSEGRIRTELVAMAGPRTVPSAPGGLVIEAIARPDPQRADVMLIPGAGGPLSGADGIPAVLAREAAGDIPGLVRAALATPDLLVATVCGGSLIPAMAGLLTGRPAVTHHMGMDALAKTGAVPIEARVVDDGNLVSGGGVTSGLDVALYLVERTLGPRIADAVERLLEYERRGTVWRSQGPCPSR